MFVKLGVVAHTCKDRQKFKDSQGYLHSERQVCQGLQSKKKMVTEWMKKSIFSSSKFTGIRQEEPQDRWLVLAKWWCARF